MKTWTCALFLSLAATAAAHAQTIEGDWQGTLVPIEIRLVLHLSRDEKGGLTASLDSPDQGAISLAVTSVSLVDSTLKFAVPPVGGSYEGKVNAGATAITGTWSQQGMSATLNLSRAPAPSDVKRLQASSDIDGDWEGTLSTGAETVRLVLRLVTFDDGMSATMNHPDHQRWFGLPVTSITRDGAKLEFEMKPFAGSFSGTLDAGLVTISGTWTQRDNTLPLVFKRVRKNP